MTARANVVQTLSVGRDANGVVQLSGSHNTITVVVSGDAREQASVAGGAQGGKLGPNPYRSLLAFDEASSSLFFGREALTACLLERIQALIRRRNGPPPPRLLGIVGASGSGKSSVARAGLIPAIARSDDPKLHGTRIAVFRPGPTPVRALAAILARTLVGDIAPVEKTQEFERVIRGAAASEAHNGLDLIISLMSEPQRPLLLLS
jgi:hypothetical protein